MLPPYRDPAAAVSRGLWAAVLVSNALWIGFVAGAVAGGRYFIARDAGLAAGPGVLGYGAAGAALAAIAALVLSARLAPVAVRRAALVALIAAGVVAVYVATRAAAL